MFSRWLCCGLHRVVTVYWLLSCLESMLLVVVVVAIMTGLKRPAARATGLYYIKTAFDLATAAVCKSHCSSRLQLTFFSQIPATVGPLLCCQSMGNYLFFSYIPIARFNSFSLQLLDQRFHFLYKISNILLQEV